MKLSRKPQPIITGTEITSRVRSAIAEGLTTAQISDIMQALAWSLGLLQTRAAVEVKGVPRVEYDAIVEAVKSQYNKGCVDLTEGIIAAKKHKGKTP